MQRRDFLRDCGSACALLIGTPLLLTQQGCTSMRVVHALPYDRTLRIPIADLAPEDRAIVRCSALPDDLYVIRNAAGEWRALLMRCTHRDQPLTAHAGGLTCSSHGSTFDTDGRALAAPATAALHRFPIEADADQVVIDLARPFTT